jgi:hypothetical protein
LIEKLPYAFFAFFINKFKAIEQRLVAYGVPMFRAFQLEPSPQLDQEIEV